MGSLLVAIAQLLLGHAASDRQLSGRPRDRDALESLIAMLWNQ